MAKDKSTTKEKTEVVETAPVETAAPTGEVTAPATGEVTAAPTGEVTAAPTGEKAPKAKLDIARGRMPLALVALIRFNEPGATVAALAKKYYTTVGKVSDIQKNRNFGYVNENFAPTATMIAEAKAFVAGWPEEKAIVEQLDKMTLATEEQAKAFDEIKKRNMPGRKAKETEAPAAPPEQVPTVPTVPTVPNVETPAELEGLTA